QHAGRCAPALVRRQRGGGGARRRRRWRLPGEQAAQCGEVGQLRRPQADAFDVDAQVAHATNPARAKARQALLPPKPNELLSATSMRCCSLCQANCAPQTGSGVSPPRLPGTRSCSIACSAMVASTMPAAPSVWPVKPLVELARVVAGKARATSAASTSSFFWLAVPCRLM